MELNHLPNGSARGASGRSANELQPQNEKPTGHASAKWATETDGDDRAPRKG